MSVVRIGLATRAPGLSRRAAQQYWRSKHARLFARLPGLLSYIQSHAVLDERDQPLFGEPGFDIFAEVEFANEATLEQEVSSTYYRDVILVDEKNLLDASQRTFLMTHRRVLAGIPGAGLSKVALFLGRRSKTQIHWDVTEQWLGEVAMCAPRARAASVNIVYRVGGTITLPVDVVLQHYFEDLADAREWHMQARRRWSSVSSDELTIVSGVIAAEVEVVPRALSASAADVHP